jgi:septal ring factor EnvC (AmiA/AmiB activator)
MKRHRFLIPAFYILSSAATAAPADGSLGERYQRSLKELEINRNVEVLTRAKRDRIAEDARDLQTRLIVNAAKVREIEAEYAETQEQFDTLSQALRVLENDLDQDRDKVAHLLAVLQRLDADMPPALAIRPEDSLSAVRSTMQLGTVLPPVYDQAAALAKRLKTLSGARAAVATKAAQGKAQAEALRLARIDLDRLLQLRNHEAAAAGARITELHGITEEIAHNAGNLKVLIDRIALLRAEGGSSQGMRVVTPANRTAAGPQRGSLRLPIVGRITPGDPAGPGKTPGVVGPGGLWFEAPGGTEAVAPGDSEVVFAGPYQKFGQVLILEIVGGYHLTLAGLGRIDVQIGDRVLAGEPVGSLPQGMPGRLYLELRRNGQTVDPAPWMSAELRKAKGT